MKIEITKEELEFLIANTKMKLEMVENNENYKGKADMLKNLENKLSALKGFKRTTAIGE